MPSVDHIFLVDVENTRHAFMRDVQLTHNEGWLSTSEVPLLVFLFIRKSYPIHNLRLHPNTGNRVFIVRSPSDHPEAADIDLVSLGTELVLMCNESRHIMLERIKSVTVLTPSNEPAGALNFKTTRDSSMHIVYTNDHIYDALVTKLRHLNTGAGLDDICGAPRRYDLVPMLHTLGYTAACMECQHVFADPSQLAAHRQTEHHTS